MNFYDFLIENNIDLGSFGFLILGVVCGFMFLYYLPFIFMPLFTLPFVLFGKWNDIKRDKFLWHTNTYLYRKVEGLYDE